MASKNDDAILHPAIGKALFADFARFKHWYLDEFGFKWIFQGDFHQTEIHPRQKLISEMVPKNRVMYDNRDKPHNGADHTIAAMEEIEHYFHTFGGQYDLLLHEENISVIRFGSFAYLLPTRFLSIQRYLDLSDNNMVELNMMLAPGSEAPPQSQSGELAPAAALSVRDVHTQMKERGQELDLLQAQIEQINAGTQKRLEEIKAEARRQIEQVERLKLGLMTKVEEMKTQIFKLESAIYTVECYIGDTVDFLQLRKGSPAPLEAPLVVNQKLRYLDEDLAIMVSIYDFEYGESELFEEVLATRDDIFEYFCPGEKCISFVRVSKTGTLYGRDGDMLHRYEKFHGLTIGILLRNGENLYFGWTDDAKIFLPGGDAFYSPKELETAPGDVQLETEVNYPSAKYNQQALEAMPPEERKALEDKDFIAFQEHQRGYDTRAALSKLFIFSIIQGLLNDEERGLVQIPEKVYLLRNTFSGSRYLILSSADGWLADNRYGDFSDILKRFEKDHKAGDTVLTTTWLRDGKSNYSHTDFDRSRDGSSRTHDCQVSDCRFYTINLVTEHSNARYDYNRVCYYVSVEKAWSEAGARSNFRVYSDEFINLTFLNSEWLRYAILNKKIGHFNIAGQSVDYAYAVHYLKVMLEHLQHRELEEKQLISVHIPGLEDACPTWMVHLSEWKVQMGVRRITAYQAKRFARHLHEKNIITKEDHHGT